MTKKQIAHYEAEGTENYGIIIEVLEDGTQKQIGPNYTCFAEAQEALVDFMNRHDNTQH